jgi:hypothetical protein
MPSGQVRVVDRSGDEVLTTTTSLATDRWVRLEWRFDQPTGRAEIRLYNSSSSFTPSQTVVASGGSFGTGSDAIQIGRSGSQTFWITFWTDDPGISSGGFLGP